MTSPISGISVENAAGDFLKKQVTQNATTSVNATAPTSTTSSIASKQDQIVQSQNEIDDASELQVQNDKKIEELEKEIAELQAQIVNEMQQAVNDGQAFSEEQQGHINDAITLTIAAYLNGEISKDQLTATLASKVSATESEIGAKFSELVEGKSDLVTQIQGKMEQICDLAKQNDDLAAKIKSEAEKIAKNQADIAAESAESSGCCDPIGFEQDGVSYDFIVDRDNDGEFDGEGEFLGAQNGFEEMKALDKDGNGVVEGEELNGVKMIKTDKKAGTQTFVTAQEAGVTSIDLSSYQAKNKDIGNGNTLAGNYNLNVNGKNVEGYQTLDNVDWLKANYGNSYGKSINSDAASSTCQTSATANAAAQEAKETVKEATAKTAEKTTGHRTLSEFKDLNTKKEEELIADSTEEINYSLSQGVDNNSSNFATSVNNTVSEEERDNKLNENKPAEGKTESAQAIQKKKPSTTSFMAMAYAMNAEDEKKKMVA